MVMDATGNTLPSSGDKLQKLDKTMFTVVCHSNRYSNDTQYS